MSTQEVKVAMQIGTELRINNDGEITVDNPEVEGARDPAGADAILSYQFDSERGQHVLKLLDPLADHKHMRTHREGD